MRAVRVVFRSELQHRWRSWLALTILVTLVGGTVLGAVAAGRRTAAAFPRFLARYGYDVQAFSFPTPLPKGIASLPDVSAVYYEVSYACGSMIVNSQIVPEDDAYISGLPSQAMRSTKLVSGRMPVAPDEVLAGFAMQQQFGLHIGSIVTVPLYSLAQASALEGGNPPPRGARISFRVVGVEANVTDFPAGVTPVYNLYTSPAFDRGQGRQALRYYGALVRLRDAAEDLPRFQVDFQHLPGLAYDHGIQSEDSADTAVERSIHPQAVGWWLFALFVGLVGLAVVGQALSRQSSLEAESYPTLQALGFRPSQVFTLGMARAGAIGLTGAIGAVLLAFALSPLTPVGEARIAEPAQGFAFDVLVLGLGAASTVVVTVLLTAYPAWRATRFQLAQPQAELGATRASVVVAGLARAGAPASVVVGTSRALERGRGRASVPVLTALLGTVVAVTALVATAVFGASLSNLVSTPALYGMNWQVDLSSVTYPQIQAVVRDSAGNPAITKITAETVGKFVEVRGITVPALIVEVVRGPMAFSLVAGRYPTGEGKIALGATTLAQAGAHIGSRVAVTVFNSTRAARTGLLDVVGIIAFPPEFATGGFGIGAVVSVPTAENLACPRGPNRRACLSALEAKIQAAGWELAIGTAPGRAGRAASSKLQRRFASVLTPAAVPQDLANFGQAVNFPALLGATLAIFGAAALAHLLLVSVARRRREVAILKVLGFVRLQVGAAVCWQSATVVLVGVVLGVPIGIGAGRVIWRAFASNLGVVPVDIAPVRLVIIFAVGALAVGGLLALVPAMLAARTRPAEALREP
ncbi:MAG: FtsX-like permease family protein [Acidimicrobiales bacterium]